MNLSPEEAAARERIIEIYRSLKPAEEMDGWIKFIDQAPKSGVPYTLVLAQLTARCERQGHPLP